MATKLTKFVFTSHAKKRLTERGITEQQVIETVTHPNKRFSQYKGNHKGWVYLFHRKYENQTLAVVAELFKDTCYQITGYWT